MEIRHLRYFIAVAELRNFTKAAQASFVAQSALSQQIGRLEHELGAPLFVRGKRGVTLTPAGELLLPHARRLVADEAWARAEMRSYLGLEKGRLTVGLIQTSSSGVDVIGAVAEFSARHPGIELRIVNRTTAELVEGVRQGSFDLAVVGIGPDELPDGLESRPLAVDPLVGVASERLADGLGDPVSVVDLLGRGRLIQFAAGTGIRSHFTGVTMSAELLSRQTMNTDPPARDESPLARLLPRRLWRTPTGAGWGPLPELLLILTAVTGIVDAVSILALGRVFVANMTGNVVFAGFAIAGAPGFSLGASLFALAGFLVGAYLGGQMTTKVGHDHALHLRAATVAEFALTAVALIVAAVFGGAAAFHGTLHLAAGTPTFDDGVVYALAAVLAVAMGIQNAVARKLAVPDLTTTVLTMLLTGIGHDSRSGRGGHVTLSRRVLVVATMLAGGVAGALLVLHVGAVVPLALATGLLAIVAVGAVAAARRPGEWRKANN